MRTEAGAMSHPVIDTSLIGGSPVMRRLRALIARAAPTSLPVLIQGPTGSGKELVAEALHLTSGRPGRFVAFNVCAIPETMLEDALFGHVRGAFTGAVSDAAGYLAEADRGTAFFDEITGIPPMAQAKLLRILETHEFRAVGASRDRRSDFRAIAATNDDLDALVRGGRFRADLAHRLQGVVITVPLLRERLEDVPALTWHFLVGLLGRGAADEWVLTQCAFTALAAYDWPGNVRELRHCVERLVMFASGRVIDAELVASVLAHGPAARLARSSDVESGRRRLLDVLERLAWDTDAAARHLGVDRATVYRQMKRYGIPTAKSALTPSLAANAARRAERPA